MSPEQPGGSSLGLNRRLLAWVDESGSSGLRDPGTYLLAAAVSDSDAEDEGRDRMQALLLPGQVKVHWRDESERRRAQIVGAVAGLSLEHVVVVRSGATGERPERRRRKCMERLLYELEQRGVDDVVLESRGPDDDQRDVEMVNALRGQKRLSPQVRLSHRVGRNEPMLWIPDAVCGAVVAARGGVSGHLEVLGDDVTNILI